MGMGDMAKVRNAKDRQRKKKDREKRQAAERRRLQPDDHRDVNLLSFDHAADLVPAAGDLQRDVAPVGGQVLDREVERAAAAEERDVRTSPDRRRHHVEDELGGSLRAGLVGLAHRRGARDPLADLGPGLGDDPRVDRDGCGLAGAGRGERDRDREQGNCGEEAEGESHGTQCGGTRCPRHGPNAAA